jgi:hypothetical protein
MVLVFPLNHNLSLNHDLHREIETKMTIKIKNRKSSDHSGLHRLSRRAAIHSHHAGTDVRALPFVPPENQRARDVDRGIGACDDADEEGERKVVHWTAAEYVERSRGEEHRAGGDDRAAQGLIERLVHQLAECAAHAELQVFTDTIKDHDGVVDREADDGEQRRDGGAVHFTASQEIDAHRHQQVVQDGDNRCDGE